MIDVEKVDFSSLSPKRQKKARAWLYHHCNEYKKKEAMMTAGIQVYSQTVQWNAIEDDGAVVIFCKRIKDHADPLISRQKIIDDLKDYDGKDKLRAIELIAKLKGYFDSTSSELDSSKPIYVVTGARRGKGKR